MHDLTEHYISAWHGIEPPNAPARRLAAQLNETIAAFARLRAEPDFEAPPGDFADTLQRLRDCEETT